MLGDVAFDGGLKVDDTGEGAPLQAAACERGEESFDRIEP